MKKPVDEGQPFIGSHVALWHAISSATIAIDLITAGLPSRLWKLNSLRRCSNAVVYQAGDHRVPAIQEVLQFELATYLPLDAWRRDHNHSHAWGMTDSRTSKYRRRWAFPPPQRIGQEDGPPKSQDSRQFACAKRPVQQHQVIA